MTEYTVHEPPEIAATREERAATFTFVPDKFSWAAAIFGLLYFLARGYWFGAAVYIALAVATQSLLSLLGAAELWSVACAVALNVLAGFEAHELQRAFLDLRGWTRIGNSYGRSREEAEARFIESWLPQEPLVTPQSWMATAKSDKWSERALEDHLRAYASKLRARYATRTSA